MNDFSETAYASAIPIAIEAPTVYDPQQLSRAQLLNELLAPVPPVRPDELHQACEAGPLQGLSGTLGATVARRLLVAKELLCREMLTKLHDRPVTDSPKLLAEWLRLHCGALDYEVFLVLFLDAQHRLIAVEQLFRGTLMQTTVYPREVLKQAIAHGAAALAFAHNHPSAGSAEPSLADQRLTDQLKAALAFIDVCVLDHFIVAGDRHYSFAEHGLI